MAKKMDILKLKEKIKKEINGEYATEICKKCGSFICSLEGNIENAKIIKRCENCFRE